MHQGKTTQFFVTSLQAIIVLIILPLALLIPDMISNHIKRIFYPSPTDKILYKEKNKDVKIKKGSKSPVMPMMSDHSNVSNESPPHHKYNPELYNSQSPIADMTEIKN